MATDFDFNTDSFPHGEHTWPNWQRAVEKCFAGVSEDEIRQRRLA